MKKIIAFVLTLLLLVSMCSCGKYISSYKALGLLKSQTSHSCEASFHSLEGQLVYKIRKSADGEGDISYNVKVDKGEICIYYDANGEKEELVRVKEGETVEDVGGYVEGGKPVYIIIEATETAKGKVSVELDH